MVFFMDFASETLRFNSSHKSPVSLANLGLFTFHHFGGVVNIKAILAK